MADAANVIMPVLKETESQSTHPAIDQMEQTKIPVRTMALRKTEE